MTFIIPTPEQFADPSSEFNNPVIVQEEPVESLIKKIFELYKKSSSIMYSDLKYPKLTVWKQAAEKISAQGWHIGIRRFPDEPAGTMIMPGFDVVCLEPQTKMTADEFARSLIVVEEIES